MGNGSKYNRLSDRNKSGIKIRNRAGFWIIIIAAAFLETIACIQYFYSREGIRREAIGRAESELGRAELEINVVTAEVEMAVKDMAMFAERYLQYPDSMFAITRQTVMRTPNMTGAAIGFIPNYYPEKGFWYEAYSSEVKVGDKSDIQSNQIGNKDHDYLQAEWFINGTTKDSCCWCEPYYDNAGAKQMLVSCSYPIRNSKGEIVAVALGDISLEHLKRISEYLQIYPESSCSITSSGGKSLVDMPDTIPGKRYSIFKEVIDATGWSMAIIIPNEIIYKDLNRIGLIVNILMILGLALLFFITYRSAKDAINLFDISTLNERMESELRIGHGIQMAMLPKSFPPFKDCENVEMHGVLIPQKEVGGDLYDFFLKKGYLYFCIGDVSGKGVPAALVMSVTRALFRTITAKENDPAKIIEQMNNSMAEMNDQNMFVTLFLGALNLSTGELRYCNAGHNAPILMSSDEVIELDVKANLPLGIFSGYNYATQSKKIEEGDILFLYTDGITEAENNKHMLYGEERLKDGLRNIGGESTTVSDIVVSIQKDVESFVGKAEQSDDITMLALRYLPKQETNKETNKEANKETNKEINNAQEEHYQLELRSDIEQIPTLAEWLATIGLPEDMNMPINLALEEAVSNVMLYAYPDKKGSVLIEATKTMAMIKFIITDSGIKFDPTKLKEADITLSAEERAIGGLGIHLVRQLMDKIEYERKDNKNQLTLIKLLSAENI